MKTLARASILLLICSALSICLAQEKSLEFKNSKGESFNLSLTTINSEPTFRFPVNHVHTSSFPFKDNVGCYGYLFISSRRISFESLTDKEHSFDVSREDIRGTNASRSNRLSWHILVDAPNMKKQNFWIANQSEGKERKKKGEDNPAYYFYNPATENFSSAVEEFNRKAT